MAEREGYSVSGLRLLIKRRGLPVVRDNRGTWMPVDAYEAARAAGVFGSEVGGPKGPRPVPAGYVSIDQAAARLGHTHAWATQLIKRAGLPLRRERGALFVEAAAFERWAGEVSQ